jgi:hypothetical protein
MVLTMLKKLSFWLVALVLATAASCSREPVEQVSKADEALTRAKSAEAEQYAPEVYRMAADTLKAAMAEKAGVDAKFKLLRNYSDTERMLARAEQLADRASKEAATEKDRMRVEAAQLIEQTRAVVDSATVALKAAPTGKGSKADIEIMKNDLAAAGSALEKGMSDFDAGRYASAKANLNAALKKARGVSSEIALAMSKKAKR